MVKKDLRKKIRLLRDAMSREENLRLSERIAENLFATKEYVEAENILTYVSFGSEADTYAIIRDALKRGKKVAVPRIDNGVMVFYVINGLSELVPGYYGIPEPDDKHIIPFEPEKALMIVPGMVFDRKLNRIGYGGGFYDRYFSETSTKDYQRCGLAFELQVVEEDIEAEEYDIPLRKLVTEKKVYEN